MKPNIIEPNQEPPIDRVWSISMIINSFKGRKEVEVYLFRPSWHPEEDEAYEWNQILGGNARSGQEISEKNARMVVLESFTIEERDQILEYLMEHYQTRLGGITARPLEFPIPLDIPPLSVIPEGKSVGFIRFEKIPHFSLPFAMRGLYDLSRHKPMVEVRTEEA